MINELILMNGYGIYVWSAFSFTLISFVSLYTVIKRQYLIEQNKFISKFSILDFERTKFAKSQSINKEILSNVSNI
jgi:heme exporter protein D